MFRKFSPFLKNPLLYAFFVVIFFATITLPRHGFFYDEQWWAVWMESSAQEGVVKMYYNTDVNYLPLYIYFLKFVSFFILKTSTARFIFANYLKLLPLFFDLCAVVLAGQILKKMNVRPEKLLFLFLNGAFLFNTLIWGQVDAIPSFFIAFSLWMALNKKPIWAVFVFILAVNFKLQYIIFFPLIGLLILPQLVKEKWLFIKILLFSLALELIILLPFVISGNLYLVWGIVTSAVGTFPFVTYYAYNFWIIVVGLSNASLPDSTVYFLGITYRNFGLMLFGISTLIALIPIIKLVWQDVINKIKINWLDKRIVSKIFLIGALCSMNFFFFNTQMHERYIHPAVLLLAIASILDRKYYSYALLSVAYLLNLVIVMEFSPLYKIATDGDVSMISVMFAVSILLGFAQLYSSSPVEFKKITNRYPRTYARGIPTPE